MLISTGGTVIKMPVEDVKRLGRSTQGVIVMRLREGETVSALAPVIESEEAKDENGDADAPARQRRRTGPPRSRRARACQDETDETH